MKSGRDILYENRQPLMVDPEASSKHRGLSISVTMRKPGRGLNPGATEGRPVIGHFHHFTLDLNQGKGIQAAA